MILSNLISNAVKFNQKNGSVHVAISSRPCTQRNDAATHIDVTNTGGGFNISSARLKDPFVKGGEHNTGSSGLGLGLSIVSDLAARLGYELSITSETDGETVVSLSIPELKPR